MNESDKNPRRYQWPWWVLAVFLLGVALAILWMSFAVRKVEQERGAIAPPSGGLVR
jgi:type VI protein secretion system component VasK